MAKTLVQSVVSQLQKERSRLEDELHRVSAALTAFGRVYVRGSKGIGEQLPISCLEKPRLIGPSVGEALPQASTFSDLAHYSHTNARQAHAQGPSGPQYDSTKADTILESDMIQECSRPALRAPRLSHSQVCSSDHR